MIISVDFLVFSVRLLSWDQLSIRAEALGGWGESPPPPKQSQKNHELAKSSRNNNTDTVTLGFSNLVTFNLSYNLVKLEFSNLNFAT